MYQILAVGHRTYLWVSYHSCNKQQLFANFIKPLILVMERLCTFCAVGIEGLCRTAESCSHAALFVEPRGAHARVPTVMNYTRAQPWRMTSEIELQMAPQLSVTIRPSDILSHNNGNRFSKQKYRRRSSISQFSVVFIFMKLALKRERLRLQNKNILTNCFFDA